MLSSKMDAVVAVLSCRLAREPDLLSSCEQYDSGRAVRPSLCDTTACTASAKKTLPSTLVPKAARYDTPSAGYLASLDLFSLTA